MPYRYWVRATFRTPACRARVDYGRRAVSRPAERVLNGQDKHPISLSRGFPTPLFLHYLSSKWTDVTLWRTGDAELRTGVVACGVARVCARRLHAIDARTVVECQFYPKGPGVAGPSALCAGGHPGDLSPAYCRLHAQRAAGHDPGRYQRALSLLRPAGRQGGPLRRDGGGGSAGLVRRRYGWPYG